MALCRAQVTSLTVVLIYRPSVCAEIDTGAFFAGGFASSGDSASGCQASLAFDASLSSSFLFNTVTTATHSLKYTLQLAQPIHYFAILVPFL